jgi:hypothetical protein
MFSTLISVKLFAKYGLSRPNQKENRSEKTWLSKYRKFFYNENSRPVKFAIALFEDSTESKHKQAEWSLRRSGERNLVGKSYHHGARNYPGDASHLHLRTTVHARRSGIVSNDRLVTLSPVCKYKNFV